MNDENTTPPNNPTPPLDPLAQLGQDQPEQKKPELEPIPTSTPEEPQPKPEEAMPEVGSQPEIPTSPVEATPASTEATVVAPAENVSVPQTPPVSAPNPATSETSVPEPANEIEDKAAKRKMALKRVAMVLGVLYLLGLLFIVLWAFAFASSSIGLFNYLPVSQKGFSAFLMMMFNIMFGALVLAALGFTCMSLAQSFMAKKEEVEKKKAKSKRALIGGVAFFLLTVLWLLGLAMLSPRLIIEEFYESPIRTNPESTVGLTAPVTVEFDASQLPIDMSTYQVIAYTWNFGDGTTGNGQRVSHRYTQKGAADGRNEVTLSVDYMDLKSGATFDAEFSTEVIIVNELVAAVFTASPQSGELPLTVQFDASGSYDPDGEIVNYEWDFDGDGQFDDGTGERASYEFKQEGEFEVTLRVTDNNGEFSTSSMTIEAGSVGGLRAVITSELAEGEDYTVGERYEFTGELSRINEGSITRYNWDFGDGSKVQSRTASHTYSEPGNYTVVLTVQDANGNTDEATLEVQVIDDGAAPAAIIETTPASTAGTLRGPVPLRVVFDASNSIDEDGDIIQYQWDLDGDGEMDEVGNTVTYTYQEVGTFTPELTVIDAAGNQNQRSMTVNVTEQGIQANLEVSVTNGEVPLQVRFDASGSTYKEGNIVSYEYDFGDGGDTYVSNSSISYRYTEVGNFTASVTVIGDDGERDTAEVQIVVRPVALTACFTVQSDRGGAPFVLSVDPGCSSGTIDTYEWNFGDGEISFDRKPPIHVYEEPGLYTVTLNVTGDAGVVDSFEKTITVQ